MKVHGAMAPGGPSCTRDGEPCLLRRPAAVLLMTPVTDPALMVLLLPGCDSG